MSIDRDAERTVFDIAVGSLDFSSGFLDDEQVEALRRYAVYLGVDPWAATPPNHQPKYCPGHEWEQPWLQYHDERQRCRICAHTSSGPEDPVEAPPE